MSYSLLTVESKSWIKRFSHRKRYTIASRLLDLTSRDRVLDFGAGDGYFVRLLDREGRAAEIVAFDPGARMLADLQSSVGRSDRIRVVDDIGTCAAHYFNKIACLEVLEHLDESGQHQALTEIERLLAPDGCVVISVPLEIGPSALAKLIGRRLAGQPHPRSTIPNALRSLVGLRIERDPEDLLGHIGFDHRAVRRLIRMRGWTIRRTRFSPLPVLRSFLNSQVFFVIERG